MGGIKRKVTAFVAALGVTALALSINVPKNARAEGSHTVVMHFEDFNGGSPLVLDIDPGMSVRYTLDEMASNYSGESLMYPEPENGKAIIGWTIGDSSTSFNFYSSLTEDMDIYPTLADVVDAGVLDITVDESILPAVGDAIPEDIEDMITVPEGYEVASASYYYADETATTFENDQYYFLSVLLMPEDGKTFNYYYNEKNEPVFSVEGATVNGSKANTYWFSELYGSNTVEVDFPFVLGNPDTSELSIHYNGHGGQEDKTIEVPNNFYFAPEMLLDMASGESVPEEDGYVFLGWYGDPEFTIPLGSIMGYNVSYINSDTEYYAKWAKLIDEVNFTIETPLCGEEVRSADGEEIDPEFLRTEVGYARLEDMENGAAARIVITNEPNITCDVEGVDAAAAWITSETPIDEIRYDTEVSFFIGTIYGENDYTFVINARTPYEGEPIYFSKDLKVFVNGEEAKDLTGYNAVPDNTKNMSLFGGSLKFSRSTKAGTTSDTAIVTKGGNNFAVIGTVTADHDWDDGVITKEPGCEEDGIKTYTCRIKDASYDDEIDAFGHKWLEWKVVKPATEVEEGLEMRVCDNDGEHTETRVIPKIGSADAPTETPADTGTKTTPAGNNSQTQPQTGDDSAIALKAVLTLVAMVLFVVAAAGKKETK